MLRLLHPFSAVALIVGIVIGAGIFKTPSLVAALSGDAGWALVLWVTGALISIVGALCYAELCTAYPNAGGDYHFLHRAFGRNISFIYGWSRAMIINTGSIALLAFVFGDYISTLVSLGTYSSVIWALLVVVLLTAVNLAGIHASSRMQTWLTVTEIIGLLAVVLAGFWVEAPASGAVQWFAQAPAPTQWGLCLVFVLLTFGGWNEAAYISAELKGGPRTMVWVILASMLTLTVIYLLVNTALLLGLGLSGLSQSKTAASDMLGFAFGPLAQKALGMFVAIAALTSINATMFVGARTNFAVGTQEADGFSAMVEFTAPVFWGFLFLVGLALLWLRHKDKHTTRPFKVPLYPVLPLIFCAACGWLTYSSVTYAISQNAIHVSMGLIASGIFALLILRGREKNL